MIGIELEIKRRKTWKVVKGWSYRELLQKSRHSRMADNAELEKEMNSL